MTGIRIPLLRQPHMEAQIPLTRALVAAAVHALRPWTIELDHKMVGREVRHRLATPASPPGCGGSIPPPSAIRARSPIGRRRHLEVVNSAGSNPAVRTKATVAQLVGGSGFKHRAVSVRIGPVAPRWRSPTAEAASLKLVSVSVQIGPPAPGPFPLSRL